MPNELEPHISEPQYTGDEYAFGSPQLTMLARSFEQLEVGKLDDFFPDRNIDEETIVIEQVIEGLGIMPVVDKGVPSGNFMEADRMRSFTASPLYVREDDFIDISKVNQIRKAGTLNTRDNPTDIIQRRVQKMMNRHRRTVDKIRADIMLGGVDHFEPRTGKHINVDTQIPAHNFFSYNNYNSVKNAGADLTSEFKSRTMDLTKTDDDTGAFTIEAASDLSPGIKPDRKEAFLFMDNQGRYAGVPWTDRRADVVRCIRMLKRYFNRTNKVKATHILMDDDLYTILHENEYISQFMGVPGMVVADDNKVATGTASGPFTSSLVSFNGEGELATIGGLPIKVMDGIYRDPEDSQIKKYWPDHKVVIAAQFHNEDRSARLGMTHHCIGEAPDGSGGVWMRSGPDQLPPSPPGKTMQMGDAFLPFAVYPHWISVIDVAPEGAIKDSLIINQDLDYGTF